MYTTPNKFIDICILLLIELLVNSNFNESFINAEGQGLN